jgi:hypothetical protein
LDRGNDLSEAIALEQKRVELETTAQAARAALPSIEERIAEKRIHVETLQGRRSEFIDPVLGEILEASGIHSRIEALRIELAALENVADDFGGDRGLYGH